MLTQSHVTLLITSPDGLWPPWADRAPCHRRDPRPDTRGPGWPPQEQPALHCETPRAEGGPRGPRAPAGGGLCLEGRRPRTGSCGPPGSTPPLRSPLVSPTTSLGGVGSGSLGERLTWQAWRPVTLATQSRPKEQPAGDRHGLPGPQHPTSPPCERGLLLGAAEIQDRFLGAGA